MKLELGKILIISGFAMIVLGSLLFFQKAGRLFGDFSIKKGNIQMEFFLGSSILISVLLTIILNLFLWIFKK